MRQVLMIALLLIGAEASAQPLLPKIDVLYPPGGTVFDRNCESITKKAADPALIDKVAAKRSEFQAAWDQFGPTYVRAALEMVGRPFPYPAMQAVLTVCDVGSGGMSAPLLIPVEIYLRDPSDPGEHHPPMWVFAEVVFHELMHNYSRDVYETSNLRKKYASLPVPVLNHLPVVALERAVLAKVGETDHLAYIEHLYMEPGNATYKRAWEIVSAEGVDAFIGELRALK